MSSLLSPLPRLHPTHQRPSLYWPPSKFSLILFPTHYFPSYRHPGAPPACRYVVEIFPRGFAMQRGLYSKTVPSSQILTFSTLAPSLLSPCPYTNTNPSTTTPQLPIIALVTGGYQFSCDRTNQKRHETQESCS